MIKVLQLKLVVYILNSSHLVEGVTGMLSS